MSLAIDIDRVKQILLADGQWHRVADDSFEIDAYEYLRGKEIKPGGGEGFGGGQDDLISSVGARWTEKDSNKTRVVFCPLTAIQAVSYGWKKTR